jgi:hypothetical protein
MHLYRESESESVDLCDGAIYFEEVKQILTSNLNVRRTENARVFSFYVCASCDYPCVCAFCASFLTFYPILGGLY